MSLDTFLSGDENDELEAQEKVHWMIFPRFSALNSQQRAFFLNESKQFFGCLMIRFVDIGAFLYFCSLQRQEMQCNQLEKRILSISKIPHLYSFIYTSSESPREQHQLLVIVCVHRSPWPRIEADISWSCMLACLIHEKVRLVIENAFLSTLGGAYTAIKNVRRARDFALRQRRLAVRYQDPKLFVLSNLYIGYYYLETGQLKRAARYFHLQKKRAELIHDKQLKKMTEAAVIRLERKSKELHSR